jgi:hypothetical protein
MSVLRWWDCYCYFKKLNIKAINLLGVNKRAHEIKVFHLCFFSCRSAYCGF